MAVKKSELYSRLWESCDELRGGMDASQYKDYVLVLLFIKYISDKYYQKRYAPIVIPKGASFKDLVALKGKPDIGVQINNKIRGPLMKSNTLSNMPDFNDPVKLGSGKEMVERLTNLISIFEDKSLDFSKNRADGDDILGDAYEYLISKFATESGKSKGQFYTPAAVSKIMAKTIGIGQSSVSASTTVYDPTCGSGSLLLKVMDEAKNKITLYGQEKDSATSGLAQMNMILHNNPTATIIQGNTLADPKFKQGKNLKTFDYVVANPPFSDKRWKTGLKPESDPYERFKFFGIPPNKNGDYAYLLHIINSLKDNGKGACILPHGVLFRGNVEAGIRKNLIRKGYIKAIIGLPANLFYGTGIPACILIIDKKNANSRKSIFMIDASKGFIKEGPKNRLRDRDMHKIIKTFSKEIEIPGYSLKVPIEEIENTKNNFNLNLQRYIDSAEIEDLQDIEGHMQGGIPDRDLDDLSYYWKIFPSLRKLLFKKNRDGYSSLNISHNSIKSFIFNHSEFKDFNVKINKLFEKFISDNIPQLKKISINDNPKIIIKTITESLLSTFKASPIIDEYNIYQQFMDYLQDIMQDDFYLITEEGWLKSSQPREIFKVKNKDNNKLVWSEPHDYFKNKRRFKSDLIPVDILVSKYFILERDAIKDLKNQLIILEQKINETIEENNGEDGLLTELFEGEGDKQKITTKGAKARLKEIEKDEDYSDERKVILDYLALLEKQTDLKNKYKVSQDELHIKAHNKYSKLKEEEIKMLVIEGKWLDHLSTIVQSELDRISQFLTSRIYELTERYNTPIPKLTAEIDKLSMRVEKHLKKMGKSWK